MQLLSYQAPISAAMLIPLIPLLDNYKAIWAYKWSVAGVGAIGLSSFLALLVNVSTFMIIGRMSALTYNVAGHAKMCFILASGYIFFDAKNGLNWLNLSGVGVAISGVVAYSIVKMRENKPKVQLPVVQTEKEAETAQEIPMESIKKSLLILNDPVKSKVVPSVVAKGAIISSSGEEESKPLVSA